MVLALNSKVVPPVLPLGKANVLQEGELLCIWALGNFVEVAKQISESIFSIYGFKPTIVDPRFVKPLDESLLLEHSSKHKGILTLEDNVLAGFGAAVIESLNLLNTASLSELDGPINSLNTEAR